MLLELCGITSISGSIMHTWQMLRMETDSFPTLKGRSQISSTADPELRTTTITVHPFYIHTSKN
jgi:hypothetical protein